MEMASVVNQCNDRITSDLYKDSEAAPSAIRKQKRARILINARLSRLVKVPSARVMHKSCHGIIVLESRQSHTKKAKCNGNTTSFTCIVDKMNQDSGDRYTYLISNVSPPSRSSSTTLPAPSNKSPSKSILSRLAATAD